MLNHKEINEINILQWNCRSVHDKIGALCALIDMYNVDVVLLSETFLSNEKSFKISGFNIMRNDRNSRGGGVAIAIKNCWEFTDMNLISNYDQIELIGCKIKVKKNYDIDVVAVYINHNISVNPRHLDIIFGPVQAPFIIGGDFNAHATDWGCVNTSARGERVLDALDQYNASFLNDGSMTRLNIHQWFHRLLT